MIAIVASMLFAALNQTIVGTILPRIISELKGMEYFYWVFTIYMLSSSITAILVGKLSDIYGRKPFLLVGIGLFVLGSFLCGTSANIFQLITYRGIQGLGGGMVMSTAFTAVGDLFSPRERGRWQGLMSATFGLASILGPMLGGYIVDHMDWHWCFWIFLPFGIITFALIWRLFPQAPRKDKQPIDYFGSLFLTLTMIPMLLAFTWAGSKYAWTSLCILGLFAASAVALLIFILIERAVKSPVLPLALFKNSIFSLSNLINFILGAGMFGAIMYTPFFIQGVMGQSATHSSFIMIPMTLGLVSGSILSGQITSRTGKYKVLALSGLIVMSVGMFSMYFIDPDISVLQLVLHMLVIGIGLGVSFPIFMLTVQNAVDYRHLGVATSSSQLFRQLGGTIGVSIMGTIMTTTMKSELEKLTPAGRADMLAQNPEAAEKLASLRNPQILMNHEQLAAIKSRLPEPLISTFDQTIHILKAALATAINHVFLAGSIILATGFILTLFLKEIPLRTSNQQINKEEDESNQVLRERLN
nr:MDR family MFS transporter [Paenactinomyces guangxiensis]